MPLSTQYDGNRIWERATRDALKDTSQILTFEQIDLINGSVDAVLGQFYAVVVQDYRERVEVTIDEIEAGIGVIDISPLKMMRSGNTMKMTVEVSEASNGVAEPRSEEGYLAFKSGNSRDASLVIYTYTKNQLLLKRGKEVILWGDAAVIFPSIPEPIQKMNEFIDVPDGPLIELVILKLRYAILQRVHVPVDREKFAGEMQQVLKNLLGVYQTNMNTEEQKEKVQALL